MPIDRCGSKKKRRHQQYLNREEKRESKKRRDEILAKALLGQPINNDFQHQNDDTLVTDFIKIAGGND